MSRSVNKVRNPDFSKGSSSPRDWVWGATAKGARWQRVGAAATAGRTITITTEEAKGSVFWSQTLVCKPGEFYRVEATVTCDLATGNNPPLPPLVGGDGGVDDAAGFVVAVEPVAGDRPAGSPLTIRAGDARWKSRGDLRNVKGERRVTHGLHRASQPVAVRAYYMAPEGIRRLRLSVGLVDARGSVCIHHVRLIPILEPDEASHILAIPAPPHALPAPRVAEGVCVCSSTAADRPITRLLAAHLGESNVYTVPPDELVRGGWHVRAKRGHARQEPRMPPDALLLPDATPPPSIRSLTGLMKLAAGQIVVISLPAFAKLARGTLSLCRVEQDDDPIHAKVTFANYATRGFALRDTFAYAWSGRTVGGCVQNHFRKTSGLKAFCDKHGFVELLVSMCNRDVTSDRPICLYRETPGGGLFVLDIEPAEANSSTFGEPALAMHLLLCVLGHAKSGLGQYVAPVRTEADFRELIREMAARFEQFVVHDSDGPIEEVTRQLVTIGWGDSGSGGLHEPRALARAVSPRRLSASGGAARCGGGWDVRAKRGHARQEPSMPPTSRPIILVRSGLTAGDVESVYGAFVWFKQLVRTEPYPCPYAGQLTSQFRLAWVPCAARWEARDGWRRSAQQSRIADCGLGIVNRQPAIRNPQLDVAVLIDVASCPINRVRVVIPKNDGAYQRYAAWLPQLTAAFAPPAYFAPSVGEGEPFCNRDRFAWRRVRYDVQTIADAAAFRSDAHREVIAAGGQVVRIEVPGCDADFTVHSIQRTDLAATLLEQVVGLQYGVIAVNRSAQGGTSVHLDAFPPVGPGEALVVDRRDPMLRADASQVG